MAISTYKTFLMHLNGESYEKLLDITEFPDLGGDPELLETTTMSDKMQTYILGLQSNEGLSFSANYDHDEFLALKDLEGSTEGYAIWFGGTETDGVLTPDGSEGKFSCEGQLSVHVTGAGTNEVVKMGIMIAPTTVITVE